MRSSIVVVVVRNAKIVLPEIALWDGRVWQKNGHVSRDLKTGVSDMLRGIQAPESEEAPS